MYKGIDHTAIASPDPEDLAAWYQRTLGFPITHRIEANIFLLAPDGTTLEIIPSEGERVKTEFRTPGIRHLAITVEDFETAMEDLRRKGVEIDRILNVQGHLLAFFGDSDGNILHLVQWNRSS